MTRKPSAPPSRWFDDPLQQFRELMPWRVRRMLLVGSRYDFFLLWEDGQLGQHVLSEWLYVHLSSTSWITPVASGDEAVERIEEQSFDLAVVTAHVRDADPVELLGRLRTAAPGTPVVPLAFDDRELARFQAAADASRPSERPFLWQGDFRLLLCIVQSIEDRLNVGPDTESVGVSVLLLVEDSVHYASSFLPMLYEELNAQSQRVIAEGTNLHHKVMRLRARPKILHCTTYEEAIRAFERFEPYVLGLLSDVHFPRGGVPDPDAGLALVRHVRARTEDLPIVLQTNDPAFEPAARALRAAVLRKRSPRLLEELSRFVREEFGFGDFVFRDDDGRTHGRAGDLRALEQELAAVPGPVLRRHASRNHFSTWLRARTEFRLAATIRAEKASDYRTDEEIREFLLGAVRAFRRSRQGGGVADFDPDEFNPRLSFARIGGGSIGGKARGLGFVRSLLHDPAIRPAFEDVDIFVPATLVLATEVFDRFLRENELLDFALREQDDARIEERFLAARFPEDVRAALSAFLERADYPIAVRSSSLLEDSQDFSLTGAYRTYMVPNRHPSLEVRLDELVDAIRRVYAGTFVRAVKESFLPSPYRLEEEKMAVALQRVVGTRHGARFYPDLSGVALSHNVYPSPPMKAEDGVARVALGLGETVVRGENAVSFCPSYPRRPIGFSTPDEIREHSQREFFALDLEEGAARSDPTREPGLKRFPIDVAREDGKLRLVGSVWSPEDDAVHDGTGRDGVPLVTFAPILKQGALPVAEIVRRLLDASARALNMPIELEFAVSVPDDPSRPAEFAFLQLRPVALAGGPPVDLAAIDRSKVVCESRMVLGHGVLRDLRDLVVVDRARLDRSRTADAADDIGALNAELVRTGTPYVLVGVGRWGSADPWLGIPVRWNQIGGAK
ncbi:MAG: PEP/pyruvate-binding domain-containing protein, partial [Planctomycetota bacterium JB042]